MTRRKQKTDEEKELDHDRLDELVEHLNNVPGGVIEWSDGNKLRYLVLYRWQAQLNAGAGCDVMHNDQVSWDLLRIAARLDKLDDAELQLPIL